MRTVDAALLRQWMAGVEAAADKPTGRVLVVGGSRQTPGAVRLAAVGAMRAGAETVQVVTVASTAPALAVAVPELLVTGVDETDEGEIASTAADRVLELAEGVDVILVGPGFMSPAAAVDLCRLVLPRLRGRLVVDALAMAYLAAAPDFRFDASRAVLTPNTGEVGLALDVHPDEVAAEDDGGASRLARRAQAVVSSGGATSYVASPGGDVWRDEAGHGGLAASGSGDVKAGVVAAGFARLDDGARAAVWGGHLHALAGERAAARVGSVGFLASDVVAELPAVLASLGTGNDGA